MVHHRHQLDVREAEIGDVRRELVRELAPTETHPPRRRVELVDRDRPLELLACAALVDPIVVTPRVGRLVHDRGRLRRHLGLERERVRLLAPVEVVLVVVARRGTVDDPFPDPGFVDRLQDVDSQTSSR